MDKDLLNYKRFYKGSMIKSNVDELTKEELEKGFYHLIGYSEEMDNFLNAEEIDLLQEGFLYQLKNFCNHKFGLFNIFHGMELTNQRLIEDKMIFYNNVNTNKVSIVTN